MTDEVKALLFEAFFTTKPLGKGTGLGLATCQTIVQQSGGHIGVYSELAKGTTFKIYLPRVEQPLGAVTGPIQAGPLPRGTETLLVVEDEPQIRELIRLVLVRAGHDVVAAAGPHVALAALHRQPAISLMLVDVVMPEMDGYDLVTEARKISPGIHVVFMSAFAHDATRHPDCDGFLAKPFTIESLTGVVEEALAG